MFSRLFLLEMFVSVSNSVSLAFGGVSLGRCRPRHDRSRYGKCTATSLLPSLGLSLQLYPDVTPPFLRPLFPLTAADVLRGKLSHLTSPQAQGRRPVACCLLSATSLYKAFPLPHLLHFSSPTGTLSRDLRCYLYGSARSRYWPGNILGQAKIREDNPKVTGRPVPCDFGGARSEVHLIPKGSTATRPRPICDRAGCYTGNREL
ncbi:hypothetical protein CC80DRAFT_231726 [Byssothecium circinans]|uniref:Secreted protein n=1 Tax=Byssothecium circinans TaxID=147558 RepID=A0A6A5U913_9PLEO|nr:hypothetical protein CC80DRAFT_231726 [Byssothecium circinans]